MKRNVVGVFCAVKQWTHSLLLLVAVATALTVALPAQTTATTTTFVISNAGAIGLLQAGDGNFYATSPAGFQSCNDDSDNLCAYIFKVTSTGVASIFHSFQPTATAVSGNLDGTKPTSLFLGSDGELYGTCANGGPGGYGTIFQITLGGNLDGHLTVLKSFISTDPGAVPLTMIEGADGNLYWTNGSGIYRLANDGSMSTVYEYAIDPVKGTYPNGNLANSLVQGSDGNLYLTQVVAPQTGPGTGKSGAIAKLALSGQLTILHPFAEDGSEGSVDIASIISPGGSLVQAVDGAFYGVTRFSGPNSQQQPGVAYQVTAGGGFSVLHHFNGTDEGNYTNPALTLGSDGNLYGTTQIGGDTDSPDCEPQGCGTFYQLKRSGSLTTLHKFEGGLATSQVPADNPQVDGAVPQASLVQTSGGFFYGTTFGGNLTNDPTMFKSSLTPAVLSPIQLTVNPKTVLAGNPVQLSWQVSNAFSKTAQVCSAKASAKTTSAGEWFGPQTGALSNGIYSGGTVITPKAAGVYTYALTCGGKESGFVSLVVTGNTPLEIQTTALPNATVSQPVNVFLSATGGISPYTWVVSGALPKGLNFDASGQLFGTPQQFGDYPLAFSVQDSTTPDPQTGGPIAINLHVDSGLTLFPTIQTPVVDKDYKQPLNASGGLTPYTFQMTGGTLPPGLTFNATAGVISGKPTQDGPYSFTIKLSDFENPKASVSATYSVVVGAAGLQITSPDFLPNPSVGVPYTTSLTATGGMPPYFWSYGVNTGQFLQEPQGLTLSTGGVLSGTPIQWNPPNTYDNFIVTVTDSEDPPVKVTRTLALSVQSTLQMLTTSLPIGQVGTSIQTPLMATGGIPPYTWHAQSTGPDPNTIGFYLNDGNVIVEDPLQPANTTVIITVQDSEKQYDFKQITVPLVFLPAALPTTTTLTSSNTAAGTGQSVTFMAKVAQTTGVPAGTVSFFSGGNTLIKTAILDATGSASIQTSFATAAVYSITAVYGGSTSSAISMSAPLTETVVTPSISTSVNPGTLTIKSGSSGTLTITLTPAGD